MSEVFWWVCAYGHEPRRDDTAWACATSVDLLEIAAAVDNATSLAPPMAQPNEFDALLEKVKRLPPMTEEERIEQAFSFAWGNAAIEWPDPPPISFDKFRADGWRNKWREAQAKVRVKEAALELLEVLDSDCVRQDR
jgi:hypothetical protein